MYSKYYTESHFTEYFNNIIYANLVKKKIFIKSKTLTEIISNAQIIYILFFYYFMLKHELEVL